MSDSVMGGNLQNSTQLSRRFESLDVKKCQKTAANVRRFHTASDNLFPSLF